MGRQDSEKRYYRGDVTMGIHGNSAEVIERLGLQLEQATVNSELTVAENEAEHAQMLASLRGSDEAGFDSRIAAHDSRIAAEALNDYSLALNDNPEAEYWDKATFVADVIEWLKYWEQH